MRGQKLIRLRRITAVICAVLIAFGAIPMQPVADVIDTDNVARAEAILPTSHITFDESVPEGAIISKRCNDVNVGDGNDFIVGGLVEIVSTAKLEFYDSEDEDIKRIADYGYNYTDSYAEGRYVYTFTIQEDNLTVYHTHAFVVSPTKKEKSNSFLVGCDVEYGDDVMKKLYVIKTSDTTYTYTGTPVSANLIYGDDEDAGTVKNPFDADVFSIASVGDIEYINDNDANAEPTTEAPVNVGKYTAQAVITYLLDGSKSNFRTIKSSFEILPRDIETEVVFTLTPSSMTYNGNEPEFEVTATYMVDDQVKSLTKDTDYTYDVSPNGADVNTYTVTFTAVEGSNFIGTKTETFTITEANVSGQITFTAENKTYNALAYDADETSHFIIAPDEGSLAESLISDNGTKQEIEYHSYDENASNHCGAKLDSAPVNAGKYVAKLTITNSNYVTVDKYAEFEIEKATLTVMPNSNIAVENGSVNTIGSPYSNAEDAQIDALNKAVQGHFTVEGYVNTTDKENLDATVKSFVTLNVDDDTNWSGALGYYKNNPTMVADNTTKYFLNAGEYTFKLTDNAELENYHIELVATENKFTVKKLRYTSQLDLLYYMGDLGTSVPTTPGWNYDYFGRFDLTFNGEFQVINILLGGNFDVDSYKSDADKNFYPYISPDDFTLTVSYGDEPTILTHTSVNGMPKYTASVKNAGKYTLALTPTDNSVNVASIDLNEKVLTVKPYDIGTDSLSKFEIVPKDKVCNGEEQEFEIESIKFNNVDLTAGTDYEIVYAQKGTAVGSNYEYSIEGRGNFTGTYSGKWEITAVSASNITGISLDLSGLSDRIYNGEEVTLTDSNVVADQNNSLAKYIVDSLVGGDVTYTFAPIVADFDDYAEITNWTTTAPINAGTYAVKAEIRSEQHTEAVIVYDKFTIAKATITVTPDSGIHVENGTVNTIGDDSEPEEAKAKAISNAISGKFTISGIFENGDDKTAIENAVKAFVTLKNPSWSGAKGYDYGNVTNEIDSTVRCFLDAGEYEFGLTCSEIDNYKIEIAENANKFVVNKLDLSYSGNLDMIFYTDDPCDWNPYAALIDMTYSGYDQSLHILVGGNWKINDYDYFYPYIRSDEYTITIEPNKEGAVAQTLANGSTGEGAMPSYVANVLDAGPYIITLTPAANSTNLTQNVVAKTLTVDPQTMENVIAAALDPNDNTSSVSWTLSKECNGQPQTMSIESLVYHGITLHEGTDYTLQSDMQVNVNTLTDEITNYPFNIYAVVDSNFSGRYSSEWEITPATAANAKNGISFDIADKTFDGQAVVNPKPENLKVESGNDLAKHVKDNATNITTVYASVAADFDGDFTNITDWTATPVTVGKYAAKATVSGTQFAAFDIYDTFTISKKAVTLTMHYNTDFPSIYSVRTNGEIVAPIEVGVYGSVSGYYYDVVKNGLVKIMDGNNELDSDDYANVGTYTYAIDANVASAGNNANYEFSFKDNNIELEIDPLSITGNNIITFTEGTVNFTYNGTAQSPTYTLTSSKFNNASLALDTDYTITGNSQTNADEYTATIEGIGNYTGTIDINWKIATRPLEDLDFKLNAYSGDYDGSAQHPTISVNVDLDGNATRETPLEEGEGKDYTVAYYKLVNSIKYPITADELVEVGSYRIEVTGIGNYRDTVYKTYTIWRADQTVTVKPNTIIYDGKPVDASDFTVTSNAGSQMGDVTFEFYTGANGTGKLNAAPTDAGTYYVRASVEASDNYLADDSDYVQFTISKRKVSITPASDNKVTYGTKRALDSTDLKYTVELAQETGNTGFVRTGDVSDEEAQAQAKTLFGNLLTVGKEKSTTNIQHTGANDNYNVTIATNDAGTYAYEDFRSLKQIGQSNNNRNSNLPFYNYFRYGYSFQLYTAAEVGNAAAIDSLSINIEQADHQSGGHSFDIYLMDVDAGVVLSSGDQNTFNVEDMTLVFSGNRSLTSTGWKEFKFNKVYNHDPSKQLLVLFLHYKETATTNNLYYYVYPTDTPSLYNHNYDYSYKFNGNSNYYCSSVNYRNEIKLGVVGLQTSDSNYDLELSNPNNNVFTVEKKDLSTANITLKIGRNKDGSDATARTNNTVTFDSNKYYVFYDVEDLVDNDSIITENDLDAFTSTPWRTQPGTFEYEFEAAENGNYTGDPIVKEWTITNRQMAVTVEVAEGNYTYTGEAFDESKLSVTTGVGLNKEELTAPNYTITYKYRKNGTEDDYVTGTPVNAGEYEISADITANGTTFTVTPAILIIAKKTLTFTPASTSYTKVYGEDDPVYEYTLVGIVDADADKEIYTGTISRLDAATHENAGNYDSEEFDVSNITLTEEGAVNYVIEDNPSTNFTLTIEQCQIKSENLIIKTPKLAYTGSVRNVEYEVVVNGKTVPASEYDVSGLSAKKVGTYTLEISSDKNSGNYYTDDEFQPVEGEWEIVEDERAASFKAVSVDVSQGFFINYKLEVNEALLADKNAYILFTSEEGMNQKVMISDGVLQDGRYVYRCAVNPDHMGDAIKATVYFGDGTIGKSYSDYSILKYANNKKNSNPDKENLIRILDSTLEYGAAYQIYTETNVDNLVNKDVESVFDDDIQISNDYSLKKTGSCTGVSVKSVSLDITSIVTMNEKLVISGDIKDYEFIYKDAKGNHSITPTQHGSQYWIEISNITPNDYDYTYEIIVRNLKDDSEVKINYSVYTYIKNKYGNAATNDELKAILKAMYYLSESINNY